LESGDAAVEEHQPVLDRLGAQGELDCAVQPGLGQRPGAGGELTGPNPTDRARPPSLYHLLVDATELPLNVLVSGANRHDSPVVERILDPMPATRRGGRGHPRRRPARLHGDKGYDDPSGSRKKALLDWLENLGPDGKPLFAAAGGAVPPPSEPAQPPAPEPSAEPDVFSSKINAARSFGLLPQP